MKKNSSGKRDQNISELLLAVSRGCVEEVERLLLPNNLDINHQFAIKSLESMTPLQVAVKANRIEVVKVLLAHGATIRLENRSRPQYDLRKAKQAGNSDVMQRLLEQKTLLEDAKKEGEFRSRQTPPISLFAPSVSLWCLTMLEKKLHENPTMADEMKVLYRDHIREIYISIVNYCLKENCFRDYKNFDSFYDALCYGALAQEKLFRTFGGNQDLLCIKPMMKQIKVKFKPQFIDVLCSQYAQKIILEQQNVCFGSVVSSHSDPDIIAAEYLQDGVVCLRTLLASCGIKSGDKMEQLVAEFFKEVFSDAAVVDRFLKKGPAFLKEHIYDTVICDDNENIKSVVEARFAERVDKIFKEWQKEFWTDHVHLRNEFSVLLKAVKSAQPLPKKSHKPRSRGRLVGSYHLLPLPVHRACLNETDREALKLDILKNVLISEIGDKLRDLLKELGTGVGSWSFQAAKNRLSNLTTSRSRLQNKANKFIRVAEMLCEETVDVENVLNEAIKAANISTSHAKGCLKTSRLYQRLVAVRENLKLVQEPGALPITASANGWTPCVDMDASNSTADENASNEMLKDLCDISLDEVQHHKGEEVKMVDPEESAAGQGNYQRVKVVEVDGTSVEGQVISVSDGKNGKHIPLPKYPGVLFASRGKEDLKSSSFLVEVVGVDGNANGSGVKAVVAEQLDNKDSDGVCEWYQSELPVAPSGRLCQKDRPVVVEMVDCSSDRTKVLA
jgi:hypothetical protein